MIGGLARSASSITNIPVNGYMLFPNADDNGNWYFKDWQGNSGPIGALNPTIGSARVFGSKMAQQNTTDINFISYLTINVPNGAAVPTKHELFLNYVWNYASGSQDFIARIMVDNVQLDDIIIRNEPKDPGADQRYSETYFNEILIQPGGSIIDFQFASSAIGTQASLFSARMRSMRVE